jgi:2-haloacid dehalogenase
MATARTRANGIATMTKLVTFDVYMALLDIQGSLVPVLSDALGIDVAGADPLVRTWRAKQMERAAASNSLDLGRFRFRDCTRQGLDYTLGRAGLDLPAGERERLVMAWDDMRAWPEAVEVVAEVKRRGYATAILSNGDQDMLEAVARQFGDALDHVLSAELAGVYKPHPKVYQLPGQKLGIAPAETLHVAGSPNDVLGTKAFGIRCYWSNRAGDLVLDPALAADWQGQDLRGVLDIL